MAYFRPYLEHTSDFDNEDQRRAWDSFYSHNVRPWGSVTDLGDVPFPDGSHILEAGCGNGKTVLALRQIGMHVTAMDFSSAAIDSVKDLEGVYAVRGDITDMPFPDDSFDGAVCFHVLEHLTSEGLLRAAEELDRVLIPGSYMMVKVFSEGDMRSGKGRHIDDSTVVRGNGIMYHYFTEGELEAAFGMMDIVSAEKHTQTTRFGTVRSRIHAVFRTRRIRV